MGRYKQYVRMKKMVFLISLIFLCFLSGMSVGEVLQIPQSTKTIEEIAFYGDTSLDEVVLPEGLKSIEKQAFAYSSVKHIVLPSTLRYIAEDAFLGCNIEQVEAVEGSRAYEWAVEHGLISSELGLVTIHVPDSVRAGEDIAISFDPVEGATWYYGWITDENNSNSELAFSDSYEVTVPGYMLSGGNCIISVTAVDSIHDLNTVAVIEVEVLGKKPDAPVVSISNERPRPNEDYYITIDTQDADLLHYEDQCSGSGHFGDLSVYEGSTVLYKNETALGKYDYKYAVRINGLWSEWSDLVSAIVLNNPNDPIEPSGNPEIIIPDNSQAGMDMVIEIHEQEGVDHYSGEIAFSEGGYNGEIIFRENKAYVDGYVVGEGVCTVYVQAHPIVWNGHSFNSQASFSMIGTRETAPKLLKVDALQNRYVISFDTKNCDKLRYTVWVNGGGQTYNVDVEDEETSIVVPLTESGKYFIDYQARKGGRWTKEMTGYELPVIQ